LFDLSMYTASLSLIAFTHPLIPVLSIGPKSTLLPVLAFARPFTPGEGWKSGFMIAPQLGWQASGVLYGTTQLQQRLLPLLAGDRGLVPDLPVRVEGAAEEGLMMCEAPKPRMSGLRTGASWTLRLMGALAGR
jgi:hypothetical protein